jgi:hypothetical protein
MTNALHNARYERHLAQLLVDPVTVDGDYGIVCTLVPRCEGIIARFTVRDLTTTPSEVLGERNEKLVQATFHLMRCYDIGPLTAATALASAEQEAWRRLHDQGVDVPADLRGDDE